jgi:hypothetical protein
MHEALIHIFIIQETKEYKKCRQWFPASKEIKTQKSSSKVLQSVFRDSYGIVLVDVREKGAIIIAKYYIVLLNKLMLVS